MTTVGIIQPNFIPWRGYFDFIRDVDVFVFLDDVQYTKRDWRNRNRIRTTDGGSRWLTVPVRAAQGDLIREVGIDMSSEWRTEHAHVIEANYRNAPFFAEVFEMLEESYRRHHRLSDLDIDLCQRVMKRLGISTPTVRSSELNAPGRKDEKLIEITRQLGGTRYLSGPSAKAYIRPELWDAAGIELTYKVYSDYPIYAQISEPFDPHVSIIDLLSMVGDKAAGFIGF